MGPSEWVKDRIEAMARHHAVVWVEDPYRLLEDADLTRLEAALATTHHKLAPVHDALRLAEILDNFEAGPQSTRAVIVDRSYTLRDPHLLPKDAKPSDLRPLPAPEWKPTVPNDAFFRPNVRDFLVSTTGVEDWPVQVNIFPYEKLARERPIDLVRAYETFRRMGRALTDDDLVVVGASAVLGVDLFDIARPLVALELAFHAQPRWAEVAELFNAYEQGIIRRHLQMLARPLGDLFGENAETARSAVVALLVLKQHPAFMEAPGKQLPFLSTALAPFRDCDVLPCAEVPTWFVEAEIPRFEEMCGKDFLDHIHGALGLGDLANRSSFAQRERLSSKLRGLVPFEIQAPAAARDTGDQDFRLVHLVPEFRHFKRDLEAVLNATRGTIENLRLRPLKDQTAKDLLQVFVDRGFHRIDRLVGRLQSLIYFIEGPARRQWTTVAGFEDRWTKELHACREAITLAGRLRDELDLAFGKLLEARYSEIVPSEVLTTDLFYEKFIGPRRRTAAAAPRKAVVLVIDSMRLDIWRELVRPALERDYEVEESIGLALLPSETRVSRRAFFAGKPPAAMPSAGRESELFADLLSSVHGASVVFEDLPHRPKGMSFGVRSRDGAVHAGVFDFPDALSHEVDWDPHTLHEAQRPLLREIRALLADVGPEALVFITADHGHILQERGAPVWIDGSDDVGYRAAHVRERIEGHDAARVFQLPARALRHAAPGWYVFPRPGHALRNAADRSRPFRPTGNYRHGGLSLFEVVVPIACLRHRAAKAGVSLAVRVAEPPVVGRTTILEVSVSADSMLASPVSLTSDHAAVEGSVVAGVTTTPQMVRLRLLPTAPGKQSVQIAAYLAGEKVGEAGVELQVAAAEARPDVARAKLAKLFGDEG
jgi:hypothetical protein